MTALEEPRLWTEGAAFSEWCAANLVQSQDRFAGQPLVFEPWQRRFWDEALQVVDPESLTPRWKTVALVVSRKNGKTAMLAALALYRLLEDDGLPEIILTAASDKQAAKLYDACINYLRRNPALDERVHRREYAGEIVNVETGGKIVRMPSSGERLDGANPSLVICDELHAWNTPTRKRVWSSMNTAGGARDRMQLFTITTAGDAAERETGILGGLIDGNEAVGEISRDPGLTVSRNDQGRTLVFNYSAPTVDPHDTAAMKLANPASWITTDFLAAQASKPGLTAAEVLQLHGCVWASGVDAWLDAGAWERCRVAGPALSDGDDVVVGVDVGISRDSTAVAVAGLRDDGRVGVQVTVWSAVDGVAAHATVPGGRMSLSIVEDHIRHLAERFQVREVVYDRRFFERSAEILSDEGLMLVELEQSSSRMADAYQGFYQDVLDGNVAHPGDPVFTAHVMATAAEKTDRGWKVRKMRQSQRIDATVAAVMACYRARSTSSVWVGW